MMRRIAALVALFLWAGSVAVAQCQTPTLAEQVAVLADTGGVLTLTGVTTDTLDLRRVRRNITVQGPATVGVVLTDGPIEVTLRDLTAKQIIARRGTWVTFAGAITVQGWTRFGVQGYGASRFGWSAPGSLTIIGGSASDDWCMHLVDHASYMDFANAVALKVDQCGVGFQLGFNSSFTAQGAGSTTVIEDTSVRGIQATDNSNWSTNKPLTYRRTPNQRDINSMSYYEAVGGVTVQ